jgi:hypothetical protein
MRTVVETPIFVRYASEVWSDFEREEFIGARVIYFLTSGATIWLLIVYKKAKFDNLPTTFIAKLREGVENAH